ncbi:MAG: divalent metal cation transporter [Parcubacteria group bacterium]|nr:divalent metal cation transporter [Parcubacteria group bacterium]
MGFAKGIKKFWKYLGAGFISGASDDDAAAITTYAIAGTRLGFSSLWTVFLTFPLMTAVQEMSARIGLASKMGLAGVLKNYYSRWLLGLIVLIMISTNVLNIGADLSGMSAATNLIIPGVSARILDIIYASVMVLLIIFWDFKKIIRCFKWLALTLLFYIAAALMISHDWSEIFRKIAFPVLILNKETVSIIIAIFGTTLAPYMFFWQTSQEAFEEKDHRHNHRLQGDKKLEKEIRHMAGDVTFGMFFSNLIKFFIMLLATTLFFGSGVKIQTIDEISRLLRPLLGDFGQLVFTLGIIGTGFLIIPILAAGSAYILSETFGWPLGLDKKFKKARGFYLVIIVSTALAMILNYFGFNPVKLLFYTAFFHGLILPPLIFTILLISNNKKIMGSYTNGRFSNALGYIALLFMSAAVILFFTI